MDDVNQIRHALTQHLESLGRAGVTHVPQSDGKLVMPIESEPSADAAAAPVVQTQARVPVPAPPPVQAAPRPQQPTPQPAKRPGRGGVEKYSTFEPQPVPLQLPELFSAAPTSPCTLSLSQREHRLGELALRVAACEKCEDLAATRTQTVFGVGNPEAKLLFIGEAPGADEDRQGEPFVGPAGQLLNKIITACTLSREDIYICNILRCRPPGNRNPAPKEAENCREFLDGQIATVDPEYIVCLGGTAAQNLLGTAVSVGKLRGRFYTHGRAKVLCTYHPSYLLRNPSAKRDVWDDMKFLMRAMGVEL